MTLDAASLRALLLQQLHTAPADADWQARARSGCAGREQELVAIVRDEGVELRLGAVRALEALGAEVVELEVGPARTRLRITLPGQEGEVVEPKERYMTEGWSAEDWRRWEHD